MFASRGDTGDDRHIDLKVILFGAGLLLLLLGIRFEVDWLVWSAVLPLGAAFVLRFLRGRENDPADADHRGPRSD